MTGRARTRRVDDEVAPPRAAKVEALWTVQDVGAYLGVPACTVYAWRSAGTGPPGRLISLVVGSDTVPRMSWSGSTSCRQRWFREADRPG